MFSNKPVTVQLDTHLALASSDHLTFRIKDVLTMEDFRYSKMGLTSVFFDWDRIKWVSLSLSPIYLSFSLTASGSWVSVYV